MESKGKVVTCRLLHDCSAVHLGHRRSVFLDRVIHFRVPLGDQVKGRSPKKLKSLIEVPNVVNVKVHVLSFNMILISSP